MVSLLPSATELVCAVGCADQLVGVSHECDFPEAVRGLPVLTRARIDAQVGSAAIDQAVRAVIRGALSIYEVDEARLAALAPDVIVTQDLCEVCAVSLDDVRRAVARLAARDAVRIVSLRPTRLGDVLGDLERVGEALGRVAEARAARAALEARIAAIAARATGARRVRVATLEWISPIMLGGTWMPELIELAGGVAVGASAGAAAPTIDAARLAELAPEVVLVKPCGFSLERALAERELIAQQLAPLGPNVRAYVTDGNAYFNRPGPRLVESLEILAACVHPDRFADFADRHARAIRAL